MVLRLLAPSRSNRVIQTWRPIELEGVLYRVLLRHEMQFEVEEWSGRYWVPSTLPLYRIGDGMIASARVLAAAAVPPSDWVDHRSSYVAPEIIPLVDPQGGTPQGANQ